MDYTKTEDIIILFDTMMPEMNGLDAIPMILNKIHRHFHYKRKT